jgi:hypothetical protein
MVLVAQCVVASHWAKWTHAGSNKCWLSALHPGSSWSCQQSTHPDQYRMPLCIGLSASGTHGCKGHSALLVATSVTLLDSQNNHANGACRLLPVCMQLVELLQHRCTARKSCYFIQGISQTRNVTNQEYHKPLNELLKATTHAAVWYLQPCLHA